MWALRIIDTRWVVRVGGVFALILMVHPIVNLVFPDAAVISPPRETIWEYPASKVYNWDGVDSTSQAAPEAVRLLEAFAAAIGTSHDVAVLAGVFSKTYGALAGAHEGEPTIIYDRAWFTSAGGRISYSSAGLLAHEYAHLIQSHFLTGRNPAEELEADRTAGYILGRLGVSLRNALIWTNRLSEGGSETHPPRAERRRAVRAGWKAAMDQKRWEAMRACKPDWSSEPIMIGGEECRMVRICSEKAAVSRLACRNSEGGWEWRVSRK